MLGLRALVPQLAHRVGRCTPEQTAWVSVPMLLPATVRWEAGAGLSCWVRATHMGDLGSTPAPGCPGAGTEVSGREHSLSPIVSNFQNA